MGPGRPRGQPRGRRCLMRDAGCDGLSDSREGADLGEMVQQRGTNQAPSPWVAHAEWARARVSSTRPRRKSRKRTSEAERALVCVALLLALTPPAST